MISIDMVAATSLRACCFTTSVADHASRSVDQAGACGSSPKPEAPVLRTATASGRDDETTPLGRATRPAPSVKGRLGQVSALQQRPDQVGTLSRDQRYANPASSTQT